MEVKREHLNPNHERHLSDEQFTELLLGGRQTWVQAHLQECAACREEAERVSGAIGDFSTQSRLWAERRAAARVLRTAAQTPRTAERESVMAWLMRPQVWLMRPQAWAGAALTIALATGIGVSIHKEHARTEQPAATMAQADSTKVQAEAQIKVQAVATKVQAVVKLTRASLKADNALLTAIDGELRADESTPASLYGLDASTSGTGTKAAKRISN